MHDTRQSKRRSTDELGRCDRCMMIACGVAILYCSTHSLWAAARVQGSDPWRVHEQGWDVQVLCMASDPVAAAP